MFGCATAVLSSTAMIISMQMQAGSGLAIGLAAIGAAAVSLLLGMAVLLIRR